MDDRRPALDVRTPAHDARLTSLIDALLEEGLPPLTEAQKTLIEERWTAYEASPVDVFPADEIHAQDNGQPK